MSGSYRRSRGGGSGFTFLELLIVLVILGILAAILGPKLGSGTRDRVNVVKLRSELNELARAQENYYIESLNRRGGPRYAGTFQELGYEPPPGLNLIMDATDQGWTAVVYPEDEGRHFCSIFAGRIDPFQPARSEIVPACDLEPLPRPRQFKPRRVSESGVDGRSAAGGQEDEVEKLGGGGSGSGTERPRRR